MFSALCNDQDEVQFIMIECILRLPIRAGSPREGVMVLDRLGENFKLLAF